MRRVDCTCQADFEGPRRGNALASKKHVHCNRARNRPEQIGYAAGPWEARHRYLRQAERGRIASNDDVTLQRKLETPAKAVAVDSGDHRLAQLEAREVEQANIEGSEE